MAKKSDFVFRFRIRNWAQYNRALVRRGSLTFWVDDQAIQGWRDAGATGPHGGRPRIYADTAIESALVVKAVFHLSLRATQGFLESLVGLMGVDLPVPNYTTVSRCRIWRKLHLGVDETTKEIVAVDLTESGVHDGPNLPAVLDQVDDEVGQVSGDKAYDSGRCYEAILAPGAVPTIPPRKNARPSSAKDPPAFRLERDSVLGAIELEGLYQWRSSSGATRQSLAENAVSRFKALVGIKLSARALERQQVDAAVKCRVPNRMGSLGLPRSERALQD